MSATTLDLPAYLSRIDWAGAPPPPTLASLRALHLSHATAIPFENLDILLGRPIALDLGALQAKLVTARRGGYCFEQNTLFAAALEALGFAVTPLSARVRMGSTRLGPRTHMLLRVDVEGQTLIADVGFGGDGLLAPVPLVDGAVHEQFVWAYQLVREGELWVMRSRQPEGWIDLYAFTLEPQAAIDFEVANWYTSTHPSSRFVHTLTAQRVGPRLRHVLRGREYAIVAPDGRQTRTIDDPDELVRVLDDRFGLRFPKGTRFAQPIVIG